MTKKEQIENILANSKIVKTLYDNKVLLVCCSDASEEVDLIFVEACDEWHTTSMTKEALCEFSSVLQEIADLL